MAGTTNHFSRPYPHIQVHVRGGRVTRIEGAGGYGEAWRELEEETKNISYPLAPAPGLFWVVEIALGTNPKVARVPDVHRLSSGGTEWERNRSGMIDVGIGTMWRSSAEAWAIMEGVPYGHLHVHLFFSTITITNRDGEEFKLVDNGRLTVLDDPEVREPASRYGDPGKWLKEDWIPSIPGSNAEGSYDDYARDPAAWVYAGDVS